MAPSRSSGRGRVSGRQSARRSSKKAAAGSGSIAPRIGIAIGLVLCAVIAVQILTKPDPADQIAARELLADAGPTIQATPIGGTMEEMNAAYRKLAELKQQLEKIPAKYEEEHTQPAELIATIDSLGETFRNETLAMDREKRAQKDYDDFIKEIDEGVVSLARGYGKLVKVAEIHNGTRAAELAAAKAAEILPQAEQFERNQITGAADEAAGLAAKGNFKKADQIVQQCFNQKFYVLDEAEVEAALQPALARNLEQARAYFAELSRRELAATSAADIDQAVTKLKQEFARIGYSELQEDLDRALEVLESRK